MHLVEIVRIRFIDTVGILVTLSTQKRDEGFRINLENIDFAELFTLILLVVRIYCLSSLHHQLITQNMCLFIIILYIIT